MDIRIGAGSSYPSPDDAPEFIAAFTALGDYLYFKADDGTNGYELWRTNGTITQKF